MTATGSVIDWNGEADHDAPRTRRPCLVLDLSPETIHAHQGCILLPVAVDRKRGTPPKPGLPCRTPPTWPGARAEYARMVRDGATELRVYRPTDDADAERALIDFGGVSSARRRAA